MTTAPAVIDTNVVVSGFLTALASSPTVRILDGMLTGRFRFLLSLELLTEYRDVLRRPRIRRRHELADAGVDIILTDIVANAVMVEVASHGGPHPRRADAHLWRLLAAAPGATLVTGDLRLIERPVGGSRVITAREFADSIWP